MGVKNMVVVFGDFFDGLFSSWRSPSAKENRENWERVWQMRKDEDLHAGAEYQFPKIAELTDEQILAKEKEVWESDNYPLPVLFYRENFREGKCSGCLDEYRILVGYIQRGSSWRNIYMHKLCRDCYNVEVWKLMRAYPNMLIEDGVNRENDDLRYPRDSSIWDSIEKKREERRRDEEEREKFRREREAGVREAAETAVRKAVPKGVSSNAA